MFRRNFLHFLGGAAAIAPLACAGARAAGPGAAGPGAATAHPGAARASSGAARIARPGSIRAVAFDVFTIFDPRSVTAIVEAVLPGQGAGFAAAWRTRQFEYGWQRAAADQYADFAAITVDSLRVTAREHSVALSEADVARLAEAYTTLTPWPDSASALRSMQRAGLRLAPLSNFAPKMLTDLLGHAGLTDAFEFQLSTDAARSFKPHPRAYQLGVDQFGLPREQIAFAAFGGWDAAGATWFGYPTFWVNRLGAPLEALVTPTAIGRDLVELADWVAAGAPATRS